MIRTEHLRAGLAVWKYCAASAAFIFGGTARNSTAEKILEALRQSPKGLSSTDISNLLGRNVPARQIMDALKLLRQGGLVNEEKANFGSPGRPLQMWFASSPAPLSPPLAPFPPTPVSPTPAPQRHSIACRPSDTVQGNEKNEIIAAERIPLQTASESVGPAEDDEVFDDDVEVFE